MIGRKIELHHTTPEQTRQFIEAGLALVEELDPPADLREAVFVQAVGLYAGRTIQWEQVGPMMAIPGAKL